MRNSTKATVLLMVALVGSNAWWAYNAIDVGISRSYESISLDDNKIALAQSLAVLKELTGPNPTRESLIKAAERAANDSKSFEKDGFTWVGRIGLRFDKSGRLIETKRAWGTF